MYDLVKWVGGYFGPDRVSRVRQEGSRRIALGDRPITHDRYIASSLGVRVMGSGWYTRSWCVHTIETYLKLLITRQILVVSYRTQRLAYESSLVTCSVNSERLDMQVLSCALTSDVTSDFQRSVAVTVTIQCALPIQSTAQTLVALLLCLTMTIIIWLDWAI